MFRRIFTLLSSALLLVATQAFAAPPEVSLALPAASDTLPVYPHAAPRTESIDDSRMKSVAVEGRLHGSLNAGTYVSKDSPEKILGFYRNALKNYGEVIECTNGINPEVNVRIDMRSLDDTTCNPQDFGAGATELRVGDDREQRIVTVRATSSGTEFTLVSVIRRSKPKFF